MRSVRLIGLGNEDPRSVLQIGVDEPNATTTGLKLGWTKAMLTPSSVTTIATNNTPYTDILFNDYVNCTGAGNTFDNCFFQGPASAPSSGKTLLNFDDAPANAHNVVINSEFQARAPALWVNAVQGHNFEMRFSKIHDTVDFWSVRWPDFPDNQLNVIIEQCLAYDMSWYSPDPNHTDNMTHNDGIQLQGGNGSGSRIRGNTIRAEYNTSIGSVPKPDRGTGTVDNGRYNIGALTCIQFTNLSGYTTDIEIWDNWLYGGERGINAGSAVSTDIGSQLRNKFNDAQGERAGGSTSAGAGYTITMDPTTTCDTGDGTADQNIYMTSLAGIGGNPVTVRRNQ